MPPGGGGVGSDALRADLLAFSVARQAALGQEEIFRVVKAREQACFCSSLGTVFVCFLIPPRHG